MCSCVILWPHDSPTGANVIRIGENLEKLEVLDYTKFIESSHMVAIKTPKEYSQNYITKAMMVDDKIFTFDELMSKRVNAYTATGEFLYNVTTLGRSATEFINVTNFSIYDGEIYATDPIKKETLVFSTDDGKYVRTVKHPFAVMDMNKLSDNKYLFLLTDYNVELGHEYLTHSVVVTDSLHNIHKWAMPHPRLDNIAFLSRFYWNATDENIFFSHYDETIYRYNQAEDSIDALYTFDFGGYNFTVTEDTGMEMYMDYFDKTEG